MTDISGSNYLFPNRSICHGVSSAGRRGPADRMGFDMSAKLVVRHTVDDYAAWRAVYDTLAPLRATHGCTDALVMVDPGNGNDVFVTHDFPTVDQAAAFAHDPGLKDGMQRAGVAGPPRIEIFTSV